MPWLIPIAVAAASVAGGAIANKAANDALDKGQPQNPNLNDPFNSPQAQQAAAQQQQATDAQRAFLAATGAAGGLDKQNDVYNQQQGLANQLQDAINGNGPSVAQNQLNQATGQNVAATAALMAGQRGAGANAGLLARQIAQQGAATQQNAAGQAATLRAQEQIAARGQLQQQQGMLGGLATQQVGQYANALTGAQQQALNEQQLAAQTALQQRQQDLQNQIAQNQIKAGLASQASKQTLDTGNQVTKSIGSGIGAVGGKMAAGGEVKAGPKSRIAQHLNMAKGGMVPAMVSPGEIYLTKAQAEKVAAGKMSPMAGERIPGKAAVKGDSEKNDTVPKNLEVGGVVVKRTKAQDPKEAAKFVAAVKGKSGLKRK